MSVVIVNATTTEKPKERYPDDQKGFVDELRSVAMKLHTKAQAKEGERESESPQDQPMAKWEPTMNGYLRYLVDSKLVYDTLERIVNEAPVPFYGELENTGLERSERLGKDLEWFKQQGYTLPEPSSAGVEYSGYLEELPEKDPQAFICHFYDVYFGHSAGGRLLGKRVAEKILNNKELEFYKWDDDLSLLIQNAKEKLNKVSEGWTREEKNRCLQETEKSLKHFGEIIRLVIT
ncbi:hem oxygenase-like [Dillenia turbinata]|uniref:heme oxygenase (biliverdin-producing) n=1 Tax=Dillenia turbinata TaxID=194707 RepID=A0AAN8ZKR1_9MAGN